MKIKVQHANGMWLTETITLVPPCTIVLGEHLNRIVDGSGMEHFFDQEGYYDGWGRAVSTTSPDVAIDMIQQIESEREIEHGER